MTTALVRPRIDSERIKRAVQRQRQEQELNQSDKKEGVDSFYIDFLETGETLEDLLKKETNLEVIYDDIVQAEEDIYREVSRLYGHVLDSGDDVRRQELPRLISNLITEKNLNIEEKRYLFIKITNRYIGYGILQPLWDDRRITEITSNGFDDLWVEIAGEMVKIGPNGTMYTDIKFAKPDNYRRYIHDLFSQTKRSLDKLNCLENGELLDGSRISVNWMPVARYPTMNIRKPPSSSTRYTPESFIATGAATPDMMELIGVVTQGYRNMLLLGATGSGKTTVLRIVIEKHTQKDRLVYIEDSRELNPVHPHFVSLQTVEREKKPIDYSNLIRQALRMRPDRIGIQEVRGGSEAAGILKAIMAGHDGVITTGHAGSPEQIVFLLVIWLKESGIDVEESYLRKMVHEALDILVFTQRLKDGSRKITEIWEVLSLDEKGPGFNKIFAYDYEQEVHVQTGFASERLINRCLKYGMRIPAKFRAG